MKWRSSQRSAASDMARCDFVEFIIYCTHPDCVCGGAGSDSSGLTQQDRQDARQDFKRAGWTWSAVNGWRCPPEAPTP